MLSRSAPAPTRPFWPRLACPLMSSLVCAIMTASCANGVQSSVDREAPPPQLSTPARALEPCGLSVLEGDGLADLAAAYRMRGVDVVECDGKRALAVQTHAEEHRLEALHAQERVDRNRTLWQRVTPWREP